jgi:hypothetical protein
MFEKKNGPKKSIKIQTQEKEYMKKIIQYLQSFNISNLMQIDDISRVFKCMFKTITNKGFFSFKCLFVIIKCAPILLNIIRIFFNNEKFHKNYLKFVKFIFATHLNAFGSNLLLTLHKFMNFENCL